MSTHKTFLLLFPAGAIEWWRIHQLLALTTFLCFGVPARHQPRPAFAKERSNAALNFSEVAAERCVVVVFTPTGVVCTEMRRAATGLVDEE